MIKDFYRGLLGAPSSRAKRLKILLRAFMSLLILSLLLWWLPTATLWMAIKSIPPLTWLLIFAGFITGHVVAALKWRLLLSAVGLQVPALDVIKAHGAGLFANLCLPSVVGGDFVRAGVVIRQQGNAEAIALGSLADRLNDTVALILIAATASIFAPPAMNVRTNEVLSFVAIILFIGIVAGILFIRLVPEELIPGFLRSVVSKFRVALKALFSAPLKTFSGLLLSISIQSFFICLNIIIAHAIGLRISGLLWFFAWPLAKLIAMVPFSLGGIGVREAALTWLLVPFGVKSSLVVAQGLSWQAVLIFSGLFAGIVVTFFPSRNLQHHTCASTS